MKTSAEPDWNDLRSFLALARNGSLAGAARALKTQHSTIARRIDALELALAARVVQRAATGVVLTETGLRLLPLAQGVERAMEAFVAAAHDRVSPLRLALPTGFASLFAAGLARLHARLPGLVVEVISGSRVADLMAGEADIAVRTGEPGPDDLVMRKVAELGWSLYASPAYLATAPAWTGDLAGHSLIGFHADLAGIAAERWLTDHASGAEVVLRLSAMTEMLATAREGVGVALLPCLIADADPVLQRLDPRVVLRQPVLIVCRKDVKDTPEGRAMIGFLARTLKAASGMLLGEQENG